MDDIAVDILTNDILQRFVGGDRDQTFSREELLAALRADPRFVVEEGFGLPRITVARCGACDRRGGGRGRGYHR